MGMTYAICCKSLLTIFARLTRSTKVPTYDAPGVPDIFTHVGRPSGQMHEFWLSEEDYRCAHAYVLRNCDYFQTFERYNVAILNLPFNIIH